MADNKGNSKALSKLMDRLAMQSQDIFKATYHSSDVNRVMFDKVSDELTDSIKNAIRGDSNYSDISNTTRLYEKIMKDKLDGGQVLNTFNQQPGGTGTIMDMFNDTAMVANLMDAYANTKWINVLDDEIDMCLKYMPKLKTALNIKKDNVLCADNFSKSFINASIDNSGIGDDKNVSENYKYIERVYDFQKKAEQWYDSASQYGEQFVYCVPYKKALEELLRRKANTNYQYREQTIVEAGKIISDFQEGYSQAKVDSKVKIENGFSSDACIKLTMNRTGLLEDEIKNMQKATKILTENMFCSSIYEDFLHEASGPKGDGEVVKLNKTIDDVLTYDDDATSSDGLVGTRKNQANPNVKVPGCVVRNLQRSQVLPLYIEDICLGYYYIKVIPNNLVDANMQASLNGYNSMSSMFNSTMEGTRDQEGDLMLRYVAGKISDSIDSAFINSNQDLRKEIYMMLRYNDQYNMVGDNIDMNVTFIPPEDIVHIRFNEDPLTHRGRSDLWDGLMAAKMWIMINSTTVIGNVTRGQDKRVYYVKTMVETNVARTLLNVVSQIKKGNFGLRQMESINNILNIVGKFNDYVIPVGPGGESPVSFDIMQGQNFELPAELMNQLEDSAIGSTGVPLEIVNSSMSMDFAIRYTMTNGRLLRTVINRQVEFCKPLSKIYTKIYNCEFGENQQVKVTLPPPSFLMITQGSQLIQNSVQYIDALADVEMAGEPDEDRSDFRKLMLHDQLPSYIDVDKIESIKKQIKLNKMVKKAEDAINGDEEA